MQNSTLNKSEFQAFTMNSKGELQNAYSPLQNFIDKNQQLGNFTTDQLGFTKNTPVTMNVTEEYDGSTNLIINDDLNFPKLINSRFSVQENNTFNIPFRSGESVLNIYDSNTFETDSNLLKLYKRIPKLQFNGIEDGGAFKCGSYIFYFKLIDSDGNTTNLVQESSIVQIHIGNTNSPKIRMGLQDEQSHKSVKFTLSNLGNDFDYVKIFYERTSTDESQAAISNYYMITQNYPIKGGQCDILLTGAEEVLDITKADIQNEYADIQTVKTQAIVDNTLFLGNVSTFEQNHSLLQRIAWKIIPTIVTNENIGNLQSDNHVGSEGSCYYNMQNVYKFTGYWPDEYYRFGVCFIFDNNIVSSVYNLQGFDFQKKGDDAIEKVLFQNNGGNTYSGYETEPSNFIFNEKYYSNSKGVFRFPKQSTFTVENSKVTPTPIGIKFDLSLINCNEFTLQDGIPRNLSDDTNAYELLKSLHVKGLFFVRQKRIPTIIAQGMVVGLTGRYNGCIPVVQNNDGNYVTKSFLHSSRALLQEGSDVVVTSEVTNKALFVPDYEIDTATLNQFFTGQEFTLNKIGNVKLKLGSQKDHFIAASFTENINTVNDVKLTAVQKETKLITDGDNYFSSRAGTPDEAYKTEDVNNVWNKTKPQDLTASTSLIRGNWGSYVGMNSLQFEYGDIVNIKLNNADSDDSVKTAFQTRFNDNSLYSAISDRFDMDTLFKYPYDSTTWNVTCYRGDCYQNVFTHRVMTNFIDPELPTNTQIIDPQCWSKNYAVRCTAEILNYTHSNLADDSGGWYLPSQAGNKNSTLSLVIGILTGNIAKIISSAITFNQEPTVQTEFANEIAQAFEVEIGDYDTYAGMSISKLIEDGKIKKVNPKEQESQGGINIKAIFKSDDKWELHGLASINRADVNAVSFGQWITFPVCSKYNLALRDIDFTKATEEASMNKKRAFYPYEEMNIYDHLLESEMINGAAKKSLSQNQHPAYRTVPYLKQEYFNRIYWSKPNIAETFINSYRIIFKNQFKEYSKEFGSITKLIPLANQLLVVFQHGMGFLPVDRTAKTEQEASPYLSSNNVLPAQVQTLTADYGSMWKDSVIKTPQGFVYGVDTVGKKIWRLVGTKLQFISNFSMQKFLNDWIDLSEYDFNEYQGHINVKTHYNEFKHDVMFTYYRDTPMTKHTYMYNTTTKEYDIVLIGSTCNDDGTWNQPDEESVIAIPVDLSGNLILEKTLDPKPLIDYWEKGKVWNLCYNEATQNWVTFYDWYPLESCNVDNIFFSFDRDQMDTVLANKNKVSFIDPSNYTTILTTNKVFADKAFTNTMAVYVVDPDSEFLANIPQDKQYVSFYAKNLTPNIDPIKSLTFGKSVNGKESEWKFYIYDNSNNRALTLASLTTRAYIAEIRVWDDLKDVKETDNLKYYSMRDSQGDRMLLWKHGQAGLYDNQGKIKPTFWYGKQHEFNFEFIVNDTPGTQKIFNNLKIISNKTAPNKFEYEVVGEGYDWWDLKPVVLWINQNSINKKEFEDNYKEVLSTPYDTLHATKQGFPELYAYEGRTIKKLPFLHLETCDKHGRQDKSYHAITEVPDYWKPIIPTNTKDYKYTFNCSETALIEDDQLNEQRVHTESLGNDMNKYGRIRGNMQYLEDLWDIEIRPVKFKWAYLDSEGELAFKTTETRHRDKYMRVRVRYTGEDLAVIQGIMTLFDYSYA